MKWESVNPYAVEFAWMTTANPFVLLVAGFFGVVAAAGLLAAWMR